MNPLAISIIAAGRDKPHGSYLLRETFEGSNPDSQSTVGYDLAGWVASSGAIQPHYNTSPAPLEGNYSLLPGTSSRLITHAISGTPRSFYFRFLPIANTANSNFRLLNGATPVVTVEVSATPRMRVIHGSVPSSYGSTGIDLNVERHCWIDYEPGTGSDGVAKLYLSTTPTKPVSPEAEVVIGDSTLEINSWQVGGIGSQVIFDALLASATTIGSNPSY